MAKKAPDPIGEGLIVELEELHKAHIAARASLRPEIERQLRERLMEIEMRKGALMRKIVARGFTPTRVGRSVGTSDWGTVQRLLKLGAADEVTPTDERSAPVQILRFMGFQNLTGASRTTGAVWYEHEGKEFRAMLAYDIRDKRVDWSYAMHADEAIRPYIEEFINELDPRIGEGGVVTNPTNVTRVEATEED